MTHNEKKFLLSKINNEGFDYCFDGYSDWEDIKDKVFHKFRQDYVIAKKQLEEYIHNNR